LPRSGPGNKALDAIPRRPQPFEIFPSLCSKCLRQDGQNFLIANFSVIVRLFLVVW
jgi:hypothetical protein